MVDQGEEKRQGQWRSDAAEGQKERPEGVSPITYILTFSKAFVGGCKKTEVGVCAGDL